MKAFLVTGTDTEVGKTRISVALIDLLQQRGLKVAGMKPIASGCEQHEAGLRNEDALALIEQANVDLRYDWVNPYAFQPAIAPHIAAKQVGVTMASEQIKACFDLIVAQVDKVVVEGAGGWLVPINDRQTLADLATELDLPVVLVVGIKLGCINHALLTVASILGHRRTLLGWVANQIEEQAESAEIIDTLKQHIQAPCLGVVPPLSPEQVATPYLDWPYDPIL